MKLSKPSKLIDFRIEKTRFLDVLDSNHTKECMKVKILDESQDEDDSDKSDED